MSRFRRELATEPFRRAFVWWASGLGVVWLFANLPRDGGTLKSFLEWAGFPWTFAFWEHGRLEEFDPRFLAADMLLGVVVVVPLAALCAWSRTEAASRGRNEGRAP